jgi:hypothetical protein
MTIDIEDFFSGTPTDEAAPWEDQALPSEDRIAAYKKAHPIAIVTQPGVPGMSTMREARATLEEKRDAEARAAVCPDDRTDNGPDSILGGFTPRERVVMTEAIEEELAEKAVSERTESLCPEDADKPKIRTKLTDEEKKARAKASREEKKKREEAELAIKTREQEAIEREYERELLEAENLSPEALHAIRRETTDPDVRKQVEKILAAEAQRREEYSKRLEIKSWPRFCWASKKLHEAEVGYDRVKNAFRVSKNRVKSKLERRDDWFRKRLIDFMLALRDQGKLDTDCSKRVPEAGIQRVELYQHEPGVRITDTSLCLEAVLKRYGPFEAEHLGLVKTKYELQEGATRAHLKKEVENGTGEVLDGTVYNDQPEWDIKIVGAKEDEEEIIL